MLERVWEIISYQVGDFEFSLKRLFLSIFCVIVSAFCCALGLLILFEIENLIFLVFLILINPLIFQGIWIITTGFFHLLCRFLSNKGNIFSLMIATGESFLFLSLILPISLIFNQIKSVIILGVVLCLFLLFSYIRKAIMKIYEISPIWTCFILLLPIFLSMSLLLIASFLVPLLFIIFI